MHSSSLSAAELLPFSSSPSRLLSIHNNNNNNNQSEKRILSYSIAIHHNHGVCNTPDGIQFVNQQERKKEEEPAAKFSHFGRQKRVEDSFRVNYTTVNGCFASLLLYAMDWPTFQMMMEISLSVCVCVCQD